MKKLKTVAWRGFLQATVFFYALPYGSRAYGAALIVQQWLYYYSNCPESTKPRLHFCSFLISVSGEGHSTFSGAENTDL